MAMTIKTDGLDDLSKMLADLGVKAEEVAARALYDGAGVMADAFTVAAKRIRAEKQQKKNPKGEHTPARWPTPDEKDAVVKAVGIAKFRKNGGEVDTLVGVGGSAGYAMIDGKKKPVRRIARSINSGTSFMHKQPVFRKAKNVAEKSATAAIVEKANEMYEEIINGSG